MQYLWYVLALLGGAVLALAAIVAVRTLRCRAPRTQAGAQIPAADDALSQKLAGAVRFATVSTPYNRNTDFAPFEGLIDYLQQQFPAVAALHWQRVAQHALCIRWPGKEAGNPAVFLSHMDVVPVVADQWDRDPFSGDVDETYIYGRGAGDMKGHMIMVLQAAEELLQQGFVPQNDIYFCFGHDEEVASDEDGGAHNLVKHLEALGVTPGMVVDEGGGIVKSEGGSPLLMVGLAEKGYMDVELCAEQAGGHSSTPARNTALVQLARALVRLEKRQMPWRLTPLMRAYYEAMAPFYPLPMRIICSNLWLLKPLLIAREGRIPGRAAALRTTIAPTMAAGSPQTNVLPSRATANINLRLLPGDTDETVLRHLRRAVKDPALKITVKRYVPASPVSPLDSAYFRRLCAAAAEVHPGVTPVPFLMLGGTDSRHYARICPNVFKTTPILTEGYGIHGANERLERTALAQGKEAFRALMQRC